MKLRGWTEERLAELRRAFFDPAVSREACAARAGMTKNNLLKLAKRLGWFPAAKRPSRGPIRYLGAINEH